MDLIGGGRQLDASAAVISEVPLDHGIAALVQIAPTRPVQAHRFGDGRWFLELSDDGSPLRWERIGEPAFDDESVVRHLTSGPEGAIYLMRAHRGGISVFRR